jgi:Spy/CpxP family protein refolding chaperone
MTIFTQGISKTLLSLALATTITATAFAASSHTGSCNGGHHHHHNPLSRLESKLNLSQDQVAQLKPTFAQMRSEHEAERHQFQARMQAILTPDQLAKMKTEHDHHHHWKDLNLTADQRSQMKAMWEQNKPQMEAEHKQFDSQMMAVLTPAQQAKFTEMKAHWHHHHGHRHGQGHDHQEN